MQCQFWMHLAGGVTGQHTHRILDAQEARGMAAEFLHIISDQQYNRDCKNGQREML